jgi:hypothetical protein
MLCVTNTTESVHQLRAQLNMAHAQLLTFLTGSIHGVCALSFIDFHPSSCTVIGRSLL